MQCGGEGVLSRINPKYEGEFHFMPPDDYVLLSTCEDCDGIGVRQRHKKKKPGITVTDSTEQRH